MPASQRLAFASLVLMCSLAASGCWMPLYNREPGKPMVDQPIDAPTITLEFHAASGKVKATKIPLQPGMAAQDAIDNTKAGKHFRRCKIDLVRTGPLSAEPHKMPLAWDDDRNRVSHSTNYALHPNDRLLVTEDTSSALDDLVAKLTGTSKTRR